MQFPKKQISDFVERLKAGRRGRTWRASFSTARRLAGDYDPDYSNVNLVAILKDTSLPKPDGAGWRPWRNWVLHKSDYAPLLITRDEPERSADVFAIELMDMKQSA